MSAGVCLGFGDFSLCSPLLFTDASAVCERDNDGILLFCRDRSSLSPGDFTVVVRVLADLPVSVVTPPFAPGPPSTLFPFSFLFPPCRIKRGLLGEVRLRLRLKLGSAPLLTLGSVLQWACTSTASPGISHSDWATSFSRLETFGDVSMVMVTVDTIEIQEQKFVCTIWQRFHLIVERNKSSIQVKYNSQTIYN